jgi:hypothetical protein
MQIRMLIDGDFNDGDGFDFAVAVIDAGGRRKYVLRYFCVDGKKEPWPPGNDMKGRVFGTPEEALKAVTERIHAINDAPERLRDRH